jgi:DNA-binding response OmpR family regulator
LRKVLIADDETNIRNILDFTLHAEGFDVVAARNGDDAYTLALGEQPDLIVLDVMMPGTNGFETCRRLKADRRTARIPVVLLTARGTREDRRTGEDAGADAYVTKPFSPGKLVAVVQDLLGTRSS